VLNVWVCLDKWNNKITSELSAKQTYDLTHRFGYIEVL
jgi:hypothetical protein